MSWLGSSCLVLSWLGFSSSSPVGYRNESWREIKNLLHLVRHYSPVAQDSRGVNQRPTFRFDFLSGYCQASAHLPLPYSRVPVFLHVPRGGGWMLWSPTVLEGRYLLPASVLLFHSTIHHNLGIACACSLDPAFFCDGLRLAVQYVIQPGLCMLPTPCFCLLLGCVTFGCTVCHSVWPMRSPCFCVPLR